jgi:hypothetical protein
MIFFYDKKTGEIAGTIEGRIHTEDHSKMWIGDPKQVDRIVIEWKPSKYLKKKNGEMSVLEWQPNVEKEDVPLLEMFEQDPMRMHKEYRMDIKTRKFVKKSDKEIQEQTKQEEVAKEHAQNMHKRKVEQMAVINDKTQPLERRFDALVEVLNIQARLR